ncbi:hypothetical protein HPB48_011571 [Haemaphysalis longicornis]|uniref:Cytochrome P450 n=1 Tax=Haemaphysalis longicornis TaxID=44386 RepID=A0A9J6FZU2_HAELO|nr:hypothetical protein HPB48_011571 [Haemaphysalis longicornis]
MLPGCHTRCVYGSDTDRAIGHHGVPKRAFTQPVVAYGNGQQKGRAQQGQAEDRKHVQQQPGTARPPVAAGPQPVAGTVPRCLADQDRYQKMGRLFGFFGHYALDVIARCAFGTQLDSHTDATNQFVTKARVAISPKMTWKLAIGHEAMAQCILFFLAGLDTTSTTLTFATYLLAVHPDAQERLRREVDDCIATHGPEPNLDVISKLKYLHCVVSETLRLYPPATRIERVANKDYVIGDTSVKLPKGCVAIVPVYSMHRDPEFFPDPDSFNPDRFSDENMESIKPYSYLPFGAGPRNCIGMRLAIQTVKLCLLHCIHNVQFVRTENTQVPLRLKRGVGILSSEDVILGVRQRPDHLP